MQFLFLMTCLAFFAFSCTATHAVRTVGKGNGAVETTFGGPVITKLGAPLPSPNLFVGGRYGIRDDIDVVLHYNLTPPIVPGIGLNLIAGTQFVPIQPGVGDQKSQKDKGWSVSTKGQIHLITDFINGALVFPEISLAGGYRYRWLNPYLGVSIALHFFRPYDETAPLFLSPFVGSDFIVSESVSLGLRATFLDVTHNMYASQFDWIHLVNAPSKHKRYGMFGITLGFSYDIIRRPSPPPAIQNEKGES